MSLYLMNHTNSYIFHKIHLNCSRFDARYVIKFYGLIHTKMEAIIANPAAMTTRMNPKLRLSITLSGDLTPYITAPIRINAAEIIKHKINYQM